MSAGGDVLRKLCPNAQWTIYGNDYDSIIWGSEKPAITKKQFDEGLLQVENWKNEEQAEIEARRQILLDKLGITKQDAEILLGNG